MVAAVLTPDAGSISFRGLDPERDRRSYQQRLGFLSAGDRGIYARISVRRQLELWSKIYFLPRANRTSMVADAVSKFGLGDLEHRRADRLSLGQRQRLKLALTFLHGPDLAIMDEPMNSLDEAGLEILRNVVDETCGRGGVVLWCSPPGDREGLRADRRLILDNGELLEL
jgi:ABC-2 type transport system ATP-binding protein